MKSTRAILDKLRVISEEITKDSADTSDPEYYLLAGAAYALNWVTQEIETVFTVNNPTYHLLEKLDAKLRAREQR